MAISVFASELEWDNGNWPKCGRHGVSREEIKAVLASNPMMGTDPYLYEQRKRAVGKTPAGRYVFIVFAERHAQGELKLRPIKRSLYALKRD